MNVILDGPSGCGKSYGIARVAEGLPKVLVLTCGDPIPSKDRLALFYLTPDKDKGRNYQDLMLKTRCELYQEERPLINEETTFTISERSLLSDLIYTYALLLAGTGLREIEEHLEYVGRTFSKLFEPLSTDPKSLLHRDNSPRNTVFYPLFAFKFFKKKTHYLVANSLDKEKLITRIKFRSLKENHGFERGFSEDWLNWTIVAYNYFAHFILKEFASVQPNFTYEVLSFDDDLAVAAYDLLKREIAKNKKND
jgi:hypothetical protein